MTDGESLGEILAAALTAQPDHEPEPQPLSPADQAVADCIDDIWRHWRAYDERVANRAMLASGTVLAADLAPLLGRAADEVFNSLGHLPNPMLRHLSSPQGWSILAAHVAADLGVRAPDYTPTVH